MIDEAEARRQETISTGLRMKGDALRQRGDVAGARAAYSDALGAIDQALAALGSGDPASVPPTAAGGGTLEQVADLFGIRAGLLRRLERFEDALASCRQGAELERTYELKATYNRTNAIELALLVGAVTLAGAQPELAELRDVVERRLTTDEHAADDAWLWADLADCRLLLGDVREAEEAYRMFAQKAEARSPLTTLAVLDELATSLSERGDPLAPRLVESLGRVEAALAPDPS